MTTAAEVMDALKLPATARVDQRVPKKMLLENGAATAADKRAITDGIEEIHWVAALKPTTIGVPIYRDSEREYLEVAVLHAILRPNSKKVRLIELIHRAIPYPTLLLVTDESGVVFSLAHKRWALNEAGKIVLDEEPVVVSTAGASAQVQADFQQALDVNRHPRTSLLTFYQGMLDTALALQVARVTGAFRLLHAPAEVEIRRQALTRIRDIDSQAEKLRTSGGRTSQIARQVEINLQLQQLRRERTVAIDDLQGTP